MNTHKKGAMSALFISVIIAIVAIVFALGAGYWMLQKSSGGAFEQKENAEANLQKFQSTDHGYSFMYPKTFVGGAQAVSADLQKVCVRESVVFQTPPNASERFAVLVSVEEPLGIEKGLATIADSYEKGLENAGLTFSRASSDLSTIDGVETLTRNYNTTQSNIVHNTVLFAIQGSKLYIISFLRTANSTESLGYEEQIKQSLHFQK